MMMQSNNMMYKKRSLYIFIVICCATFILNYTVVKNLGMDGITIIKKAGIMTIKSSLSSSSSSSSLGGGASSSSSGMSLTVAESTLRILNYRRNRSADNIFFTGGGSSSSRSSHVLVPDLDSVDNMIRFSDENNGDSNSSSDSRVLGESFGNGTARSSSSSSSSSSDGSRLVSQHNKYTVFTNYVTASWTFDSNESITYTTHGEFRYLDNLVPLAERWEGPISIALYAPGSDFEETDRRIQFLRECTSPLVKLLVTFHIFFDTKFAKETVIPDPDDITFKTSVNCDQVPEFGDDIPSFRKDKNLPYPVNVARNLARRQAMTHFILASDIELYPSVDIIPRFLEMTVREEALALLNFQNGDTTPRNPRVYVLPIFEVEEAMNIPDTKEDLLKLLKENNAVPFHKYVCPECHKVPKYSKWLKTPYTPTNLNVLVVAKRKRPFQFWEPIYLGTNQEPWYDERLTWEGLRDKMSQGFALCILNYDFQVLDNAFLVHRPGIKKKKRPKKTTLAIKKQNRLLGTRIMNEITKTFGKRKGCYL